MLEEKKDKLGLLAYKRAKKLDKLIEELQNTTIGSLNEDVNANTQSINSINQTIQIIQTKLQSIAELFSITFNPDGTIASENYTNHTHSYTDSTISDTEDGTGTQTDNTKQTTNIN